MDHSKGRQCFTIEIFLHSLFSKILGSGLDRKANLFFDREWSRIMSILSDKILRREICIKMIQIVSYYESII